MSERMTINRACELTNSTFRTIKRRVSESSLKPLETNGQIEYFDSAELLKACYSVKIDIGDGEEKLDLTRERAKLAQEQTRRLQRENDLEEGKVAPIEVIKETLESVASQIVPLLEALPLEMKRRNPKLTAHDIMLVKKSLAKARNAIADIREGASGDN